MGIVDVDALLARTPARLLAEWQAYYRLRAESEEAAMLEHRVSIEPVPPTPGSPTPPTPGP